MSANCNRNHGTVGKPRLRPIFLRMAFEAFILRREDHDGAIGAFPISADMNKTQALVGYLFAEHTTPNYVGSCWRHGGRRPTETKMYRTISCEKVWMLLWSLRKSLSASAQNREWHLQNPGVGQFPQLHPSLYKLSLRGQLIAIGCNWCVPYPLFLIDRPLEQGYTNRYSIFTSIHEPQSISLLHCVVTSF